MAMNERPTRRTPSRGTQSGSRDGGPPGDSGSVALENSEAMMAPGGITTAPAAEPEAAPPVTGASVAAAAALPTEEEFRGWFSSLKKAASVVVNKVKDAVEDNVKDVIKAGLPIAGGAIGGFFGGPAGAAIGGKAGGFASGFFRGVPENDEDAQARSLQLLEQFQTDAAQLKEVVDQVLDQTLPVLIDEVARDVANRGSRGDGGPADDEVIERFWGSAFSKLAGAIADELPWAITKVTQYLGQGGSRGADTIDPLMVDPEVAQRFWGPAFSTVICSLQTLLPTAFEQISGQARSAQSSDGTITWQDLEGTARLRGGDNIAVTGQAPIDDSSLVELSLELPPHKSWWKSLQVRGADNALLASVEVEGSNKSGSVRVPAESLRAPGARLVFVKADGVYKLPAVELPDLAGQRVNFYWYAG